MLINGKNVSTLYISGEKFTKSLVGKEVAFPGIINLIPYYMMNKNNEPRNRDYSFEEAIYFDEGKLAFSNTATKDFIVASLVSNSQAYVMLATNNINTTYGSYWLCYDDIKQYIIGGGK